MLEASSPLGDLEVAIEPATSANRGGLTSTPMSPQVVAKRIYEAASPDDGWRVLVDRIWPRGFSRDRAQLDAWLPEVAPSTELRNWFGHDPRRWDEFLRRYEKELAVNPRLEDLRAHITSGRVTLLYSARDTEHNQAVALAAYLLAAPRTTT